MAAVLLPVALIGLVFGALALAAAVMVWRHEQKLEGFPTTPGTIITSTIDEAFASAGSGTIKGGGKMRRLELSVEYEYVVAGRRHVGTRLSNASQHQSLDFFGPETAGPRLLGLSQRFPAGAVVPVTYDPQDPARSWLMVDNTGSRLFGTAALVLLGCGGLALVGRLLVT